MDRNSQKAMFSKLKHGDKIVYRGKHTLLSTKLPDDRTGQGSSVGIHSLNPNETITMVVAKSDRDGHNFSHFENSKGQSIFWSGQKARAEQYHVSKLVSRIAFRTDYKNGLQHNADPRKFDDFRIPDAKEKKEFRY